MESSQEIGCPIFVALKNKLTRRILPCFTAGFYPKPASCLVFSSCWGSGVYFLGSRLMPARTTVHSKTLRARLVPLLPALLRGSGLTPLSLASSVTARGTATLKEPRVLTG